MTTKVVTEVKVISTVVVTKSKEETRGWHHYHSRVERREIPELEPITPLVIKSNNTINLLYF